MGNEPLSESNAVIIDLDPRKVGWFFLAVSGLLALLNLANLIAAYLVCDRADISTGYFAIFNLDAETNVPTLFSSVSLIFAAVLFALIAEGTRRRRGPGYVYWYGLSAIFVFLAIDESARLHEYLSAPLRSTIGASGALHFAWIIPYSILLLVFVGAYLRFVFRLPSRTRSLLIASGVVYVAGALGVEMIGGMYSDAVGRTNITYGFITMVEEMLELLGVTLLIYTLLDYIQREIGGLFVGVDDIGNTRSGSVEDAATSPSQDHA